MIKTNWFYDPVTNLTWDPRLEIEVLGPEPLGAGEEEIYWAKQVLSGDSFRALIVLARLTDNIYTLPDGWEIIQMGMAHDDFYLEQYKLR
jgi:hypothetical protein